MRIKNIPIIIPFTITILLCAVLFWKLFPIFSTSAQPFFDIIIENVARSGYSKSGELTLYKLITLLGLVILLATTYLVGLISFPRTTFHTKFESLPFNKGKLFVLIIILPIMLQYLIYQRVSYPLIGLFLFSLFGELINKKQEQHVFQTIALSILSYYMIVSLFVILSKITKHFTISDSKLYIISTIFILCMLCIKRFAQSEKFTKLFLIAIQFPLPLLILVYLTDHYLYQGELIRVPYAPLYYVFIISFVILLFFLYFRGIKDAKTIYLSSVIAIFIFHSFSADPAYAQPDQHHHGEQMIPWQQIVTLGQKAYDEYFPASGLFPMVNGAIQHLLLNKSISDYSPAISITMLIVCAITILLIYKHTNPLFALFFATLYSLPSYNRQYLVLPSLLILLLPNLIKNRSRWLQCYILLSLAGGLYYPLYGGAFLLSLLPFGIYQFIQWIQQKDYIVEFRKWSFFLSWGVLIAVVIYFCPLLFRMFNHVLTYSSQTILADGITLYGQSVPEFFMPWLNFNNSLRTMLYFSLRFLLPCLGIWIFGFLILHYFTIKLDSKIIHRVSTPLFLGLSSGLIVLLISYSYTLVRSDVNDLLARTTHILVPILCIYLPIVLLQYGKEIFHSKTIYLFCMVSLCIPFILFSKVSNMKFPDMWVYPNADANIVLDEASKIYSQYEVPANFVKFDETDLTNQTALGNGFVVNDQFSYIQKYQKVIDQCNAILGNNNTQTYLGFDGQGFYYFNQVRACGTGFLPIAKSYETQKTLLGVIKEKRPIVFEIDPQSNYYIYHWILTSDYSYSYDDQCFYPNELFDTLYPNNIKDDYREVCSTTSLGNVAGSFGKSMNSLDHLFVKQKKLLVQEHSIPFDNKINTKDYDFILLSLDLTKTTCKEFSIEINSSDQKTFAGNKITQTITNDTLLIPLGMNPVYLLSDVESLTLLPRDQQQLTIKSATLLSIRK